MVTSLRCSNVLNRQILETALRMPLSFEGSSQLTSFSPAFLSKALSRKATNTVYFIGSDVLRAVILFFFHRKAINIRTHVKKTLFFLIAALIV